MDKQAVLSSVLDIAKNYYGQENVAYTPGDEDQGEFSDAMTQVVLALHKDKTPVSPAFFDLVWNMGRLTPMHHVIPALFDELVDETHEESAEAQKEIQQLQEAASAL